MNKRKLTSDTARKYRARWLRPCPTCKIVYMFGSQQLHRMDDCAPIVSLDCGVKTVLSCKFFRQLFKGAHRSAQLSEEMSQRHASGRGGRHAHNADESLMVAVSSPQSPPVDPNYQMVAFLEYVNAAPLPLNSKPNVSNMVVKSLTLGRVKRRAGGYSISAATAVDKLRLTSEPAIAGVALLA